MTLSVIRGNQVEGFIDGTYPCPLRFVTEGAQEIENPKFKEWLATVELDVLFLLD